MSNIEIRQDTGYGLVPRSVMRDSSLSAQAKAIYSYLASFAGNTGRSFPSTDLMAKEMNFSRNTLFKYLKELRDKKVITVERERMEDNTFGRNIYYLHNKIESKEDNKSPCINSSDMEKPYMRKPYTRNEYTNSNNTNSNNINSNKDKESSSSSKKETKQTIPKEEVELVIDKWNNIAEDTKITKVRAINPRTKRYKMLNARIKEYGLEEVLATINEISKSSFLQGENARGWSISFDWFIAPNNFLKVLEGTYRDKQPTNTGNKLLNSGYRVSTEEDLARDEDGNLISF